MGARLPERHPHKDFFILDLQDANPKDDLASMEHPVFSLSVKPDMRTLSYTAANGDTLEVIPSGHGLATIMDKDILLYCISKLVHQHNQGIDISPEVELTAHEVMVACNWMTNGDAYARFEEAMIRLRGTTMKTSISTGGTATTRLFGIVDEADIVRRDENGAESAFGRMTRVRIRLSDWMFRSVESMEVLTISRDYFRLRRPLERRLYEIARKHVGNKQDGWRISVSRLREKTATSLALKHFRYKLKEIIEDGNIPDYGFLLDGDNVMIQRLVPPEERAKPESYFALRPDTIDRAQVLAASIGVSVFDLEKEWNAWVKTKDLSPPDNADAAFIAFCQKKQGSAPARRVVSARKAAAEQPDFSPLGRALSDILRR